METHGLLNHSDRFLRPPRKGQNSSESNIAVSTIGIESDSPFSLHESLTMLLFPQIDQAQYLVGRREGAIESTGLLRQFACSFKRLGGVYTPSMEPVEKVGIPQDRVRFGLRRVQLRGML